jgi:hypothetical protein
MVLRAKANPNIGQGYGGPRELGVTGSRVEGAVTSYLSLEIDHD